MSEVSKVGTKSGPPYELPLSVLIFHAAMIKNIKISEFAKQLGINALSLRQFIKGKTQRPRNKTLEVLAAALDMSEEEVRRRATLSPVAAPPFAEWFRNQIQGRFSRAKLTSYTGISDGALRNYLSGQTLPDADQSLRLAEVLEVEPLDLAQVLVADETVRSGGETIAVPESAELANEQVNGEHPEPETFLTESGVDGSFLTQRLPGTNAAHFLPLSGDEERLLTLWRQMHPQGRRATLTYIASLLAEA